MFSYFSLVHVLGESSDVSCPRTLPGKNLEDPVRLEFHTLQLSHAGLLRTNLKF